MGHPPLVPKTGIANHGAFCALLILSWVLGVYCKNLSLPVFGTSGREFGPVCVKSHQEYCVGNPRAYKHWGVVLNGSYQAPELADMNGDGRTDLITSSAENNSVMIFYNQGYGEDGLPVFEASASVIVPSSHKVHALHAVYSHNEDGEMAWPPYFLASVDIKADGDLVIPMLDNIGTITHPELVWRHGNGSCLYTLDLKGKLIREGVYENMRAQGRTVAVLLATGDLDADGDVDLVVQVTWLTFYYENAGSADLLHPTHNYLERPSISLVTTTLRFYTPPVLFDMDNDGDLDVIGFAGDSANGNHAIVYENIGTKYHPEMFELETHAIADLYESVCQNLRFDCTLTKHDYDGDGHKDLMLGGRDVGRIVVYPQDRAASFLHETKWNKPFDVMNTNSGGFFYQKFLDADGDGDLDMFVSSWLLTPVRTLQVEAYENKGTIIDPDYVLSSTYRQDGGLYYVSIGSLLGRKHPETGLPIYDFLLTNGSETVYIMRNNNDTNLNISSLSEPEPLFDTGIPAGKIRFFDDDNNGKLEMYIVNAYGDLDGMLESQLYTGSNTSKLPFDNQYQQTCNRINVFRYTEVTPWRHGLTRPVYMPNGTVSLNISGCVSDIYIGDYRNSAKATLIAVLFPLSLIYQFEPEAWTSYDTVLQLSDGAPTVDANRMGATLPVSATLVDLDADGNAGLLVAYVRGLRSWRGDYCEFDHPCWKGGKCDYTAFHPQCACSTGFDGPLCDTCAPNFFGKDCTPCPTGENGNVCSNKGICRWGNFASGNCVCTPPFSGPNCSEGVCPPGSETVFNFTNATFECDLCKSVYYKEGAGDESCIRCPPFSRASDDRTTCNCYEDYYLGKVDDLLVCEACPVPMITIKDAATSLRDCVCPAGYYLVKEAPDANGHTRSNHLGSCVPCPPGTACIVPGITLETLPLLPNYWRISAASTVVRRCKLEAACPGTDITQWKQDVWLKGDTWDGFHDSLCGEGHTGPLCSACKPDHFRRNRRCMQCAPRATIERNVSLGFMTVFLLVLSLWLAYRRLVTPHIQRIFNADPRPQLTQADSVLQFNTTGTIRPHPLSTSANPMLRSPIRNTPDPPISCLGTGVGVGTVTGVGGVTGSGGRTMSKREVMLALPAIYKRLSKIIGVKLRLLIIYLQVVSCLWSVLDLNSTEDTPIDDLMSTLQWINLDFAAFPSYQCVVGTSYYDIILIYTYGPLLLLALVWAGAWLLCRRAKWQPAKVSMYKDYATTASLGICFLLFAGESTRLLNFFACIRLDDGHLYNTSDMRVRCDVPSYQRMIPFIVIGVILYPIGITFTYAYLLYLDRPRICERPDKTVAEVMALRDVDVFANRSKFLWSPYEPRVWWYEVAECIRRLSLTAFLSVYQTGKTQQTVAAILLSVIAIIVFDHYMPYHSDADDMMGKVCNYVTLLTFLVALLTKLAYIKRVFITQLLLFILALSVIVCGVMLTAKELYKPVTRRTLRRQRSSLGQKHLKTIASDVAEITRQRGLSDSLRTTQEPYAEPQAEEPAPASPSVKLGNGGTFKDRGFAASPPLPPLPDRHPTHHLYPPPLGSPNRYAFEEPTSGTATLSTTFNALLHHAGSDDRHHSSNGHYGSSGHHSSGRQDQFNTSDNGRTSTLRTTLGSTAEGGDGVATTVPPVSPSEAFSLTAGFLQDRARGDSSAPPLPPPDWTSTT